MADESFTNALKSNASWADYKQHSTPEYFEKFKAGQTPTILWLGCSDSRVPETTLLGLQPGEVFVHRNIANIITASDLNALAVIEYAVVHLKVKHVVLCGHTSCGGAAAAMSDDKVGGVLDAWLTPLRVVRKREWKNELEHIKDDKERAVRLAELNVQEGVGHLMMNNVIEDAIRDRGLKVHGCIYDIGSGLLRELGYGTEGPTQPNEHGIDELTPEELGIRNGVAGHPSSKHEEPEETIKSEEPVKEKEIIKNEPSHTTADVAAPDASTSEAPSKTEEPKQTSTVASTGETATTQTEDPAKTEVKESESKDVAEKVKEALVDMKETVTEKTA